MRQWTLRQFLVAWAIVAATVFGFLVPFFPRAESRHESKYGYVGDFDIIAVHSEGSIPGVAEQTLEKTTR